MILRLGSKGSRVSELQELLKKHGFWNHPSITENFGPITQQSVINFQKDKNLTPDGIVGSKTWAELSKENVKINPIYNDEDKSEDLSDPEEEMKISDLKETQPSCSNLSELINLINSSNITRNITRLVFHCTATQQNATVESILRFWRENLKWKNPGYHIIVKADGSWTQLQDFNRITNGVAGINSTSLHISYIGGINKLGRAENNMTDSQKEVFETIYNTFKLKLPKITFHGHYEFSNKACPSFNVQDWILEVENKNIF